MLKSLFALSIVLNLSVAGLALFLVHRKGGWPYLTAKLHGLLSGSLVDAASYNTPYYLDRTSQFETLPQKQNAIVFLGDSITDQGEWAELFPGLPVQNRGISADTTEGVLARLDQTLVLPPQKIFLLIGINDLLNQTDSAAKVAQTYEQILRRIQTRAPEAQVFIQSVLPINPAMRGKGSNRVIQDLNQQLRALAVEFDCDYVDLHSHFLDDRGQLAAQYTSDGLHLNGTAYLLWRDQIEAQVVGQP